MTYYDVDRHIISIKIIIIISRKRLVAINENLLYGSIKAYALIKLIRTAY